MTTTTTTTTTFGSLTCDNSIALYRTVTTDMADHLWYM